MKKELPFACVLVLVFVVGTAHAQQYEVTPSGWKSFITTADIVPGGTIDLDIWLTGASAPQNAGGVLIDFSSSTDILSYVIAGIASPPWDPFPFTINPMPGIVMIIVSSQAGAFPDGDGDIPIAGITFQNTGPGDAIITFTTIHSVQPWSPLNDEDVLPGNLVINYVCNCTTDTDCDDGIFCNGVEICDPICLCNSGTSPCDDEDDCTLDCDEDADACLTSVCDTSVLNGSTDPCCTNSACLDDPICLNNDSDGDGIVNISDNCPDNYNPLQEDTFPPPDGNDIGDACDCEADFDCSGGVDGGDVGEFLNHFGRSTYFNPCSNEVPCQGDFNCDTNVDGFDVGLFIEDFGRSQYFNPCPTCVAGVWCDPYPPLLTGVKGRVYYSTTPLFDIKVSLLNGSTHEEIMYAYSDENGNYELVYDTPGYYCLHPDPPSLEYASIGYCSSSFIQEGVMMQFDVDLPKKLTLTSPPHMGTISDTTPTLVWEANPLAVLYNLYVEDLGSHEVVVSQDGITGTSYTIPNPLALGSYYWSVLGYDATDHLVAFGGAQFTIE